MAKAIPILRIFDYPKAIEFYIDWLGFQIDWENRPFGTLVYMQISLQEVVLHLSEHHGDSTPGANIFIEDFQNIAPYHQNLLAKNYPYNRPALGPFYFNPEVLEMKVIDPFSNRLSFHGKY